MANLNRFLQAQDDFGTYRQALSEMREGRKATHWMWFIFPQIMGLGRSCNAAYYAIRSMEEAEAYLADPVLGKRLREITSAVLSHKEDDIRTIMGGDRHDEVPLVHDAVRPGLSLRHLRRGHQHVLL